MNPNQKNNNINFMDLQNNQEFENVDKLLVDDKLSITIDGKDHFVETIV